MSVEHRLQHAARELRELPIEAPSHPPVAPQKGARRLAIAAPAVVALGLFAGVALLGAQGGADSGSVSAPANTDPSLAPPSREAGAEQVGMAGADAPVVRFAVVPSGYDERALIDELGRAHGAGAPSAIAPPPNAH